MTVRAFPRRSELPILLVLIAISAVELAVTHLMLLRATLWLRWTVGAVSLAGLALMIAVAWSIRHRPVRLAADAVTVWAAFRPVRVPLDAVAAARPLDVTTPATKARSLSMLAAPNVEITLAAAVEGLNRRTRAVSVRVDQPAAFTAAILAAIAARPGAERPA